MTKQLWLNINVKSPKDSLTFYREIGFDTKDEFSNEVSETVVFNENTLLMLVKNDFFKDAAKRDLADTASHAEVVLATQVETKDEVDAMVTKAINAGGTEVDEAFSHEGMYTRIFRDLDGHQFNVFAFTA